MNFKSLLRNTAAIAIIAASAVSCSTQRSPLPYFQGVENISETFTSPGDYTPVIAPDDELAITVNSAVPAASQDYNLPFQNPATSEVLGKSTQPQAQTYVVDKDGDIVMPILGKLHVAGLTTGQLRDKITQLVSADVTDPNVLVRILNFKVNVAGEVRAPGPQQVLTERYSILDALTAAGDLTEFGERDRVLLVRDEDGKRTTHVLNLNDPQLLSSPYFYLKQNDYVYVSPNKIRQDNSKYNQNNAFKVSVISTIVSGCSVIASLVIALTVK